MYVLYILMLTKLCLQLYVTEYWYEFGLVSWVVVHLLLVTLLSACPPTCPGGLLPPPLPLPPPPHCRVWSLVRVSAPTGNSGN